MRDEGRRFMTTENLRFCLNSEAYSRLVLEWFLFFVEAKWWKPRTFWISSSSLSGSGEVFGGFCLTIINKY